MTLRLLLVLFVASLWPLAADELTCTNGHKLEGTTARLTYRGVRLTYRGVRLNNGVRFKLKAIRKIVFDNPPSVWIRAEKATLEKRSV